MVSLILLLVLLLAVVVGGGILSAAVLGVGTLLTRVFAVSSFEASLLVLATGAGLVWLMGSVARAESVLATEDTEEDEEGEEEARVWVAPMPLRPARSGKKKRR